METTTQDRGESTSASNAEADKLCQGRHLMQRGMPDDSTRDSVYGSRVHDALAKQDSRGLTPEQDDCYETCMAIEKKLVAQLFPDATKPIVPIREKRWWIIWADGLKHSGQTDTVYRLGTKALIIEYKALAGEVPVSSKNMQLRDQTCVYEHNSPLLEFVAAVVIQPFVTHSPEICVYTKEQIMRAREEMYRRISDSNKEGAPRTAGEVQCKFCKGRFKCPEYGQFAGQMVATPETKELIAVPVASWTPAMRRLFMERLPVAEKWLEGCKAEMKALLKANPESVPGYELKPGRINQPIINAQVVFDRASKQGVPLEKFMSCVSVGKGDLKAVLKEATALKGKKLDEAMDEVLAGNTETKQSEPSIVRKE